MRIVKWVLAVVVAVPVLLVLGVVVFAFGLRPVVRPAKNLTAPTDPATVEHGRYLAESVMACASCHSDVDFLKPGPALTGPRYGGHEFTPRSFLGKFALRAPNLTPAPEGLGTWTDGEIVRALREGIGKDGRALVSVMPFETYAETLSEPDALAIVAYLRTLPPVARAVPRSEIPFLAQLAVRTSPAPVEHEPTPPAPGATVERGRWLLKVAQCVDCHASADGPDYGGGGGDFSEDKVLAPNISSDPVLGVGAYTDAELLRVLGEGVNKAGKPLLGMPIDAFKTLTEDDRRALVLALREIPPKGVAASK